MTDFAESVGVDEFEGWVSRYKQALLAIENKIHPNVKAILIGHALAPERKLSVAEMGRLVGYKSNKAASLHYGKFARLLSEHMPEKELFGSGDQLSHIGIWDKTPNGESHGSWVMYEELASALQELGWIQRSTSENFLEEVVNPVTVRQLEVDVRIGQDGFRTDLINYWGGCSVTGCDLNEALVASHIVAWAQSTDQERLDVYNGLLLVPNLDRLFDRYLISFQNDGCICLSPKLSKQTLDIMAITPNMKLRKLTPKHLHYLTRHFEIFKKSHDL